MPRIYVVYFAQDDPSKNTSMKMVRHGLAKRVARPPPSSILLDPLSRPPVTPLDRRIVAERGVTVVDGSWRHVRRILSRAGIGVRKRLPLLFAANPVNYGKLYILSSIEAVAATLYITGFREEAERILSLYKWGPVFLDLNYELLEAYSQARTSRDIVEEECRLVERLVEIRHRTCEEAVLGVIEALIAQTTGKG